ncbi:MAG: amidohydrolase [Phycisphaerales bacterium]
MRSAVPSMNERTSRIIIENARIWSPGMGEGEFAECAVVRDGRFVYVGPRDAAPDFDLDGAETIDADGRAVLPGIIDAHIHMLGGGTTLGWADLTPAANREDFVRIVEAHANDTPGDEWLRGFGWTTDHWADPAPPRREWIDGVTGDRPALLTQMDWHTGFVNSAALRRAGITREGPGDPEGGRIERDPDTNEPTGVLRERAVDLVRAVMPAPTIDDQVAALRRAMNEAARFGVTTVGDIPFPGELDAYAALAADDGRPIDTRFFLYPVATNWADALPEVRAFRGRRDFVEIAGLKDFLDGTLGSRTAYMREPFRDGSPKQPRGLFMEGIAGGRFRRNAIIARDAGLQPMAHAIGDEANHLLLNWYEEVFAGQAKHARCRAEHCQHLLEDDLERFARLGVIASMQPLHQRYDASVIDKALGVERGRLGYAWRSLLNAGATVAFGSDWPVVTMNPWLGIENAVTGRTIDGGAWNTAQNLSVAEALTAYTTSGAYALFREDDLGRIAPGYRADFLIMNESPFDADPDWSSMAPVATFVDGRRVYDAAEVARRG